MKSVNVRPKILRLHSLTPYGTDGDTLIGRNGLTEVAIFVHLIHRKEICERPLFQFEFIILHTSLIKSLFLMGF